MADQNRNSDSRASLLMVLGVEKREAPLVFPLLLHHFFLGAGLAFLFTTSSAIFLNNFEGKYLALALVVAGLFMMVTARIYAHFEHRMKLQDYLPVVVLSLAFIVLLVRLGGYFANEALVAFAMLVAYRLVYLLANLEFWGLTSLVFNVRQSKRLFGLIGSGDIPAKILGYLTVSLLSRFVKPEDLLYISVASFLVAYFMLRKVLRNPDALQILNLHSHHPHHSPTQMPESFLLRLSGNKFILSLAIFAFISSLVMGLIDFSFYGKVKHHYQNSQELSAFLGTFMLVSMGITFVLKLLLSGKLIDKLGVAGVLVALLLALILPSILLLMPLGFTLNEKAMLWFFSIIYLLRDVIKYSLLDPLFLALFQPLAASIRLKGHTVVKGLFDPLGMIFIGALLFLGEHFFEPSMYILLAIGILIGSLLWLWSSRAVSRESLSILRSSLRKRFLDGQSIPFVGKSIADVLVAKLESGNVTEAIYALRMLENNSHVDYPVLLMNALSTDFPELQLFALEQLEKRGAEVSPPLLEQLALYGAHPLLQTLASKLLLTSKDAFTGYADLAEHPNEAIKRGAIAGMILSREHDAQRIGQNLFQDHLNSANPGEQQIGLWLMGETSQKIPHSTIDRLLISGSTEVVKSAIQAAGKIGNEDSLPRLLTLLKDSPHRSQILEALEVFDLSQILSYASSLPEILPSLCKIAGRHSNEMASDFLTHQLKNDSREVQHEALHALVKMGFHSTRNPELKSFFQKIQVRFVEAMQQYQWFLADENGEAIAAALEIELHSLVDHILVALSLQYDHASMMRARQGLRFRSLEQRAGALEILDQILPRAQTSQLMHLLEVLYLGRAKRPSKLSKGKTNLQGYIQLLNENSSLHDSWTIGLAANAYLLNEPNPDISLLNKAFQTQTKFLRHYAFWLQSHYHLSLPDFPMQPSTETPNSFSPIEMVLMLKASTIFSGTPENTLAEVAAIAQEQRVSEGDILFRKGDAGECMYIIAEGKVSISDGKTVFAQMGKNDFFGELSLVETEPRSADAVAATDCLLIRIDQNDFYELIEDRVEVARSILVILARRLRNQNELIRSLEEGKSKK